MYMFSFVTQNTFLFNQNYFLLDSYNSSNKITTLLLGSTYKQIFFFCQLPCLGNFPFSDPYNDDSETRPEEK